MYIIQNNYNAETVKEVKEIQKGEKNPIINGGFPMFNICDHTTLDMSDILENNGMQTLSIKLNDGAYVTMCFMKCTKGYYNIDVKFHTNDDYETKAIHFEKSSSNKTININDLNLLALICEKVK